MVEEGGGSRRIELNTHIHPKLHDNTNRQVVCSIEAEEERKRENLSSNFFLFFFKDGFIRFLHRCRDFVVSPNGTPLIVPS